MFTKFNLFEGYVSIADEKNFINILVNDSYNFRDVIEFELFIIDRYYNYKEYRIGERSNYFQALEWSMQDIEYSYSKIKEELRKRGAKDKSNKFNL